MKRLKSSPIALIGDDPLDEEDPPCKCCSLGRSCEARLERLAEPVNKITDVGMRLVGPVFVVAALCAIVGIAFIHTQIVLPHLFSSPSQEVLLTLHMAVSALLLLEILSHYIIAVFRSPGSPTETSHCDLPSWTQCKKCGLSKPPRTHHCSYCNTCILFYDHHCPWINNCVGFNNYRSFFLFVAFTWTSCLYVAVSGFFALFTNASSSSDISHWVYGLDGRTAAVFAFIVCIALSVALGILLAWHLYLTSTAQTTLEALSATSVKNKNPFDLGWRKNITAALGPPGVLCINFFVPWISRPGDGKHFFVRGETIV